MGEERPAARDSALMRRALANAERGWGQTAPNPMVGAVIVSGDDVVADGWHSRFGEAHAEVMALAAAGERARASAMYVTLEPCTHHGQTPPCTDALIGAGVRRVVIATRDANPLAGGGVDRLRSAGIEVEVGVESTAAAELNAAYFHSFVADRPWVTLKLALSADGATADPTGRRRWITGDASRREVHRMRAGVDAVAVGIRTVLADDPELTVRDAELPRRQPTRVIFDSTLSTPLGAAVVRSAVAVPTVIVVKEAALERGGPFRDAGVTVLAAGDLRDALRQLKALRIRSLLLEGGAKLAGGFVADGLVDRLALFDAPVTLGSGSPDAFAYAPAGFAEQARRFPVVRRQTFGDDTLTVYEISSVAGLPLKQ